MKGKIVSSVDSIAAGLTLVACRVTTDGSGDPTLASNWGQWVESVTKTGTGVYRLTLESKAYSLVAAWPNLERNAANDSVVTFKASDVDAATPFIDVLVTEPTATADTAQVAADLISGAFTVVALLGSVVTK